jgi:Gas vesicle synthesis protein GvpO
VRLAELIREARKHVCELAGVEVESVSGLVRDDEGWVVTLEALEFPRVPNTTDVMATYEVTLSPEGELLGFRRVGRYQRAALASGR